MKLILTLIHLVCGIKSPCLADGIPVVAITQIIEHSALDAEREGILQALTQAGFIPGQTVKIVYQNAQGNVATASQIAYQLVSQQPTVVVAISTPSAQSLAALIDKSKVPMIFTAVTDPEQAKLVGKELITGVCDAVDLDSQIQLILQMMPHTRRIGVIYNSGETNSIVMVKGLQEKMDARHLALVRSEINKSSEVGMAFQALVGKVDVILIPNDNTAVAAMPQLVQLGIKHKLPVFALDQGSIEKGAVAGYVVDRHVQGLRAGQMVVAVLKGKAPREIPIELESKPKLMVNAKSASAMGLTIPADLLNASIKVD